MPATADSFSVAARRSAALEDQIASSPERFRVLSGDRPTGALHLGHYVATLANRVRLQDLGVEAFVVIADYQVITDRDSAGHLAEHVREMMADYLAAGIDPQRSAVFAHSAVPALNQLMLPFLSLVSVAELQRNPTVKAEAEAAGDRALSGLLLTYPVHQAADILFCHANIVPVGKDQLPHIEAARLIARRFNERYAGGETVFAEPDALLAAAPVLLGTDGTKMSKNRGNAIELRASEDETARLIRAARTDTGRVITYDPEARPEVASLILLAALGAGTDPLAVVARRRHGDHAPPVVPQARQPDRGAGRIDAAAGIAALSATLIGAVHLLLTGQESGSPDAGRIHKPSRPRSAVPSQPIGTPESAPRDRSARAHRRSTPHPQFRNHSGRGSVTGMAGGPAADRG